MFLREYINQSLDAGPTGAQEPFVIRGPVKKAKHTGGTYTIYREFPVVVPEGTLNAMRVTPDELVDGAVTGEHEIMIDVVVHFQKSQSRGSYYQPPDPDEWDVSDWSVDSIDGFELSKEDAVALKAYLGELTDDEIDNIQGAWRDLVVDEPDDYGDDDYRY